MMPMLMAFFVLLTDRRETGVLAISVVLAWFSGYAETWVAKWLLAYLAMPNSAAVVSDILSTIEIRALGAFNGVYLVPLAATVRALLKSAEPGRRHRCALDRNRRRALCRHRLAHRLAARALAVHPRPRLGAVVRSAVQPHPIPPHGEFPQRCHGDRHRAFRDGDFHATAAEPARIMRSIAGRARETFVFAANITLIAEARQRQAARS
jgi:hypothetical protein